MKLQRSKVFLQEINYKFFDFFPLECSPLCLVLSFPVLLGYVGLLLLETKFRIIILVTLSTFAYINFLRRRTNGSSVNIFLHTPLVENFFSFIILAKQFIHLREVLKIFLKHCVISAQIQ